MESRLRHDLRHPVATLSMIASTVAAFADGLDEETMASYRLQVKEEVDRLRRICEDNNLGLDVTSIDSAAGKFCEGPSAEAASDLDDAAQAMILRLTEVFDAS